jgi:hypothetical protein
MQLVAEPPRMVVMSIELLNSQRITLGITCKEAPDPQHHCAML